MRHSSRIAWSVAGAGLVTALLLGLVVGREDARGADPKPPRYNPIVDHFVADLQKQQKEIDELRKRYPFESVAGLLDYEAEHLRKTSPRDPKLTEASLQRLTQVEQLGQFQDMWRMRRRSLEMLHAEEVGKFLERDGFGMVRRPGPSLKAIELATVSPIPFAAGRLDAEDFGERVTLPLTGPARPITGDRLPSVGALTTLHIDGQASFASGRTLGYVRDRDHVAGFVPHRFGTMPELTDAKPDSKENLAKERWLVRRLELVSLLKHQEPVAYLSPNLPRMEDLRKAKTRELEAFEGQALKLLQSGEDLVVDASTNRIRMMGAVRAGKQCMECHYTQRGQLLGTFSYELHRDPPLRK